MDINEFRRRYNVKGMDEAIIKTENQGLDYTIEQAEKKSASQKAQADKDRMDKGQIHPLIDKLRKDNDPDKPDKPSPGKSR